MNTSPKDRVIDRLAVVRGLIAMKTPIAKPSKVGVFPDGTAATPWDQHDSLINYLLLTCFDVLGQERDFVDFKKWIVAKKFAKERQEALASFEENLRPLDVTSRLVDCYNRRFGVTKGFFRFIDETLTPEARETLLQSIAFAKRPAIEDADEVLLKKKRFLYDLRNQFTHGAVAPTTVSRMEDGSRVEIAQVIGDSHITKKPYRLVSGRVDREGAYLVADWPYVLYATVAGVVGEPVPEFESMHTVMVTFASGDTATVAGVPRHEFLDPKRRAQLLAAVETAIDAQCEPGDEDAELDKDS